VTRLLARAETELTYKATLIITYFFVSSLDFVLSSGVHIKVFLIKRNKKDQSPISTKADTGIFGA